MDYTFTSVVISGPDLPADNEVIGNITCSRQPADTPAIQLTARRSSRWRCMRNRGRNTDKLRVNVQLSGEDLLITVTGTLVASLVNTAGCADSVTTAVPHIGGVLSYVQRNVR